MANLCVRCRRLRHFWGPDPCLCPHPLLVPYKIRLKAVEGRYRGPVLPEGLGCAEGGASPLVALVHERARHDGSGEGRVSISLDESLRWYHGCPAVVLHAPEACRPADLALPADPVDVEQPSVQCRYPSRTPSPWSLAGDFDDVGRRTVLHSDSLARVVGTAPPGTWWPCSSGAHDVRSSLGTLAWNVGQPGA